ncbi:MULTISPECIES: ABC transporter permease [unclassified Haladaptatus]|uniref:ABC transporter permease n=1 Tax=unclassified Haladaptatus TaxID=2622732 RepID=UPI00209C4A37|nr:MULTISPECIES: ABC transporter permease [unclassified Haladaptatus]MCO8244255.1 ABC transporter permease [Haladaptatus sp. AB643]MCO8254119.1 ABC transporter permease [Haladaptatus sp. AB618]
MTSFGRVRSEAGAAWRSFLRRRTAVFFTFFFPVILILIFAVLVQTNPGSGGSGGLFSKPPAYYLPGYLAVVVLFTPLSRVGSSVSRHRESNRFEKLATTPLTRAEWLLAHTLVNVVIIGLAGVIILVLMTLVTSTGVSLATLPAVAVFIALAVALFCGLGSLLGSYAGSSDGVIAASNAIALPLLFLSDTFVTPDLLPSWFRPIMNISPLTYFARGVRTLTYSHGAVGGDLVVLAALAVLFFLAGSYAIPETD